MDQTTVRDRFPESSIDGRTKKGDILTPEQISAKREEKIATRRYYLISLSDRVIPEGEPFRCTKCGVIVQTVYNEPKAQVEVKIAPEDVAGKMTGSLCRKDNILYNFV